MYIPYFSDYKTHHFPPNLGGKWGVHLTVRMKLTWLAWGGCDGGGAGSPLQEAGGTRSDAAGPGLGGGGVPVVRSKEGRSGVPAAAHYSAREEGTGGAGTLGEESLQHP